MGCITGHSQVKYDTVNWRGINYFIYSRNFVRDYWKSPLDSLPEGYWIAYYPNKEIAFRGEYRNKKPYDTIKFYNNDHYRTIINSKFEPVDSVKLNGDSIEELFYFRNGRVKYYAKFSTGFTINNLKWELVENFLINKSNDTITQFEFGDNNILYCKRTFVISKEEASKQTFYEIDEGTYNFCRLEEINYYSDNEKFQYKEVIKYDNKGYGDEVPEKKCYNKRGRLIKCP